MCMCAVIAVIYSTIILPCILLDAKRWQTNYLNVQTTVEFMTVTMTACSTEDL